MRNSVIYIIFMVLMLFLISGCIDPYKPVLDKNDSEFILVVEGLITNQPGSFEIKLSRSVPVDTAVNSFPERGAFVVISDNQGNTYEFFEAKPGVYKCTDNEARAFRDREYQLNIIDNLGNEYESSVVTMMPTPGIKRVYWKEVEREIVSDNEVFTQKGINIYVEGEPHENEVGYFKWDFSETWEIEMNNNITVDGGEAGPITVYVNVPPEKKRCWVTRSAANILLKSVEQQRFKKIDSFLVKTIPEYVDLLHIKYSIEVKQYCIDKEMFEFWEKIKEFNEDIGTMYDHVPFSIYGNISCCNDENKQVLGYFDAVEIQKKRIFIDKGDHHLRTVNYYDNCNYFVPLDPAFSNPYHFVGPYYAGSGFCSDCRNTGSNVKPDFWD